VLDGTQLPPKGAEPPIFGPCLLCPNVWMDQDAAWYGGRPRPRRHCIRWERSSPPPKKRHSLQLSVAAHVYCGETARWIKMPLGREEDLSTGDIVLYGDPAPIPKGAQPSNFRPTFVCPNGWMDQVVTWYGGRPRPRPHCGRQGSRSPKEGHSTPYFSSHI